MNSGGQNKKEGWRSFEKAEKNVWGSRKELDEGNLDSALIKLENTAKIVHKIVETEESRRLYNEINNSRVMDYLSKEKETTKEELDQKLDNLEQILKDKKSEIPLYKKINSKLLPLIDINEAKNVETTEQAEKVLKNAIKYFHNLNNEKIDLTSYNNIKAQVEEEEAIYPFLDLFYNYLEESEILTHVSYDSGYSADIYFKRYVGMIQNDALDIELEIDQSDGSLEIKISKNDEEYNFRDKYSKRYNLKDEISFLNNILEEENSSKRFYYGSRFGGSAKVFLLNKNQAECLDSIIDLDNMG